MWWWTCGPPAMFFWRVTNYGWKFPAATFPRFDRNMNTGEEQASATRMAKAANVVYHDREHPSALILPLVP